jgi:predicted acyltransferase
MNAITVFVLSGLVARTMFLIQWTSAEGARMDVKSWIFQNVFAPLASPMNASLLFAIAFISVMFIVVWFMWKRKWFLKV